MAEADRIKGSIHFKLRLKISPQLSPDCCRSLFNELLAEDLASLNTYLCKTENMGFINVSDVSLTDEKDIDFTFTVDSEEELDLFLNASECGALSNSLRDYIKHKDLLLKLKWDRSDPISLSMKMGRGYYHQLKALLYPENSDEEREIVINTSQGSFPGKLLSDISLIGCTDDRLLKELEMVETSVRNMNSQESLGYETKLALLPSMGPVPSYHQHRTRQSQGNPDPRLPTCWCDFYIFLTKKANMNIIFLSSEYQEFNNLELKAVPGSEGMWEGHVQIPVEKMKTASYCYVAQREVGFYPFNSVKTYKSHRKFMNSYVQRYEFVPEDHSLQDSSTKEGYLMHCMHILNHSNRLNVFSCIHQIERLFGYSFSFDEAVDIMAQLQTVISSHNSQKSLIILAVIMMINVKNIWKFFEANQISKDMVKSIMESFKGTDFVNFSVYCKSFLPHLLQSFCMFYSGKDYNLLHFIYWTYPFLDEHFFIQQIVQHATNQNYFMLTDGEHFEILREVIFIIANKVEINAPAVGLLERLFRHLPLSLSFRGYKYLCKICLSPTNEIHNNVKDKLSATLSASFVENISVNASQGKMSELFQMWEIVQDEDVAIKVRDKLQQSLVSFIEKRADKMLSSELQSLEKMIFNAKLFVDKNTHEHLLRVLGQSKIKNLHELFVTVLWNSKYSDCLIQHPNLLLQWLETALKSHVKDARKEDKICPCYAYLHDALAVPIVPKDGQLKEKLEDIVFKWLSKLDVKQVLRKLDDIEKLNEKKSMVLDLYQKHVLQLLEKQSDSSRPEDILLSVCGTMGELCVNSRITSQLVQKMMELYCRPFESDQYENFINMTKISKFWILLVNMEGPQSGNTKKHDVFSKGMICLEFILESLASCSITCNYVEKIAKVHDAKELLTAIGKKSRFDIDRLWKHAVSAVQKEKERMTHVMEVLKKVRTAIPGNRLPVGWENFEEHVKDTDKRLKGGKLSTGYVMDGNQIWSHCLNLPEVSEKLRSYIDSQVFWNACLDILSDKPYLAEQNEPIAEEEDIPENELFEGEKGFRILDSLKYLFCQSDQESDSFTNCVHFLEVLVQYGVLKYREDWTILYKNEEIPMTYVIKMFENADILAEIKLQEKNIQLPIASHKIKALKLYHDFDKFHDQANAIKMALEALEIAPSSDQTFYDAMNAFDKLTCSDIEKITLEQVYKALSTIARITSDLNEEILQVLWALSKARPLINFVKEVADVDFRNLIDAVEEVSEQSVNEATVSGLIDVKRFLQPVLKKDMATGIVQLFQIISDQMKDIKPNELVGKIVDCRDNVHNLRSLYNNVANRGMRTREIINNVIKNGIFSFQLDSSDDCVLSVEYQHGKKHGYHEKDNLTDMRSRALLLMNIDSKDETYETTKKKENLQTFVLYVDIALEISQLLTNIHISGHFKYKLYKKKMKVSGLKSLKEDLDMEYGSWCARLEECREKHYWMNFIFGQQLHVIHDFLEEGKEKDRVLSMLQFIHPDVQVEGMKEYYAELSFEMSESSILDKIALTLNHVLNDLDPVCRTVDASFMVSTKITDFIRPGKLSIIALEENSNKVMKTMLALYNNTVQKLPEPHQVLFCSQDTTWVEIQLLLHRCVRSDEENLFCIANVEMLANEIQFQLVEALHKLPKSQTFLLAIICCGTDNHPFVNEFCGFLLPVHPLSGTAFRNILQNTWPDVCTITSDVPGLGKTETIRQRSHEQGKGVVTFHISGPLNKVKFVEQMAKLRVRSHHILHIDIGNIDNPLELDAFLFEIIILGFASAGRSYVHLPTEDIFIEIANTINHQLRDALQTAMSFKKKNLSWQNYTDFIVSSDINSPVQVVCHYLNVLDDGTIDSKDIYFTGKKASCPLPAQKCQQLLRKYFPGTGDMSFNMARIFINVLADQLKKMSCSAFFRTHNLQAALGEKEVITIKSNLLHALLNTSSEFASRSVNNCRKVQASAIKSDSESKSKTVEPSKDGNDNSLLKRVEGMIRWEDSNHLIFVFHNQDIQTLSAMYRDKSIVPSHVKNLFESQVKKVLPDFKSMSASEMQDILQRVARINPSPLAKKKLDNMAKDYALTPDNLLKMVLIMLRIKAHIPVLIMGETGCGKTSLIRYLSQICEVSFHVVQMHAGVEEHILEKIHQISRKAEENLADPVWLFLDEINTCNHLGLISDILCHHRCFGKTLATNLVVMAACNPYKLRPEKKVLTAGLQGKIKTDEMSRLVYRVFPLPETMLDYVWDFGSISEKDEEAYVHRMIQNVFVHSPNMDNLLADLLIMSQRTVREIEESDSCVSLRDVNRCKLLTKWFQDFLKKKKGSGIYTGRDFQIRCMILALAHCYHSRLASAQDRKRYRMRISYVFHCHEIAQYKEEKILDIITEEQRDILKRMDLPAGTAHNTALQENVFVILVCILNRIPIFVVGTPGCSKSLSMQVIRSNLRGKDSKDTLFKLLPQLNCVSFQGSESSTSDGIIKVFDKAQRYQENNNPAEELSVVILDEIGLAEISKFNPLKVLHSLLEPEGKQFPDVAVVGISNWSLDAAKMNRAIHLSRPEMDEKELYMTGKSIGKSMERKMTDSEHELTRCTRSKTLKAVEMDKELRFLANSYMKYVVKQTFANFHGLRDYYSLVKFIARILSQIPDQEITDAVKMDVITRGLQRNFGGQHSELSTLLELFKANLQSLEDHRVPVIDLITENIQDKMARHLMLITSGDSAVDILEQQLDKLGRDRITIYGSQFEEDLTDDYNYRILNKIIICMEQGLVLVLKDLDSIYGSLYDMLNQNYTVVGEKKNCRVALGPYSNPMCQVHDDFRCIVLVDESKIDHADPPFLNRFEKQNLKLSDILSEIEHVIIGELDNWVKHLTNVPTYNFEPVDIFPVYGADTISSLVHKCLIEMKTDGIHDVSNDEFPDNLTYLCKQRLLWIMKPDSVLRCALSVFGTNPKHAKELKSITEDYFNLPIHEGLEMYIHSEIMNASEGSESSRMFMIFTNSNVHTNVQAIMSGIRCQVDKLGAFKSEKQLTNRMQLFWSELDSKLLVLQCKPSDDEPHILLARNVIERTRKEYLDEPCASVKHVCMIMHLDRMKSGSRAVPQINFLTDWKLVMLDSLEQPRMPLAKAVGRSLVETIKQRRPLYTYIQEQLFWAFTRIQYAPGGRDVHSIDSVIKQIQSSGHFLKVLDDAIFRWIEEQEEHLDVKSWQVEVACNTHALYSASTFSLALENYIAQVINDPLARILFELEKLDALSAFLHEDASNEVQSMWKELFNDPKLFSIQNTPKPTEAECFSCSNPILQFKMPFFRVVYEKIESTKSFFLEAVQTVKSAAGIEDVHEIPDIIWKELLLNQENMITQEVQELEKFTYSTWLEDYQNDFFHVTSYQLAKGLSSQQRAQTMRWCLLGEVEVQDIQATAVITNLHAAYWIHFGLFQSELQLLDMCIEVLEEKGGINSLLLSISNDSITEGSLDSDISNQECQNVIEDDEVSASKEIITNDVQEKDGILDNTSTNEIGIGSSMPDTTVEKSDDKIPLLKADLSENTNQEKKKRCEQLVEQLCKMLLPTDMTLGRYSDVSVWHQKVTSVLAIAKQVSMDPSVLHALRLCCDVVIQIVLQQPSEIDRLKQLGSLLQNDLLLDSKEIRDLMRDMIETNKNLHKDNSQRLIAAYCSRCIAANPDTEIISWLMDLISDQSLPDNMMTNLKPPIHHALHTELGLDHDIFFKLLENDDSSLEIMEESPFLSAMDVCLQKLYDIGLVDSPFPALLIDILDQDIMREWITIHIAEASATTDPQVQYFLKADKILQTDSFSLRHVTAIAYIRSFMTVLSLDLEERNYDISGCQVVMQTVNALLSRNGKRIRSLQVFLLKCLGKEKWIFQLQRICMKLSDHLKCYEEDKWQKDFDLKSVEMSPVSSHIAQTISSAAFDAAKEKESIKTLVQRAISSTDDMLYLNNEVMRHFYMKKLISDIIDITRCEMIVNCAKEMNMEWRALSVLECFCGTSDFKVKELQLHEESASQHKDIASIVGHLIVILTGYGCDAGKPVSIFAKGLLDPVCLSELFLPGMPETIETKYSQIPSACFTSEDENFRILTEGTIVDLQISALCKLDLEVNYIPCKGYCLQHTSKFEEITFGSRKISNLSGTILNVILHGCLLGSIAVDFASVDDIHTLLDKKIEREETISFIVEAMEMELRFLSLYLGLPQQDTIVFLHHVLYQTKAMLCDDKRCMVSEAERAEWEKEFSEQVDIVFVDRYSKVISFRREQYSVYGLPLDALENFVQEADEIEFEDRTQTLPSLWRSTVAPSFESLFAELQHKKEDFLFLHLVLNNLGGIKLLKHISAILHWHLTCFANVSFTIKKRESEEMTISEFLHKESDEIRRQLIKDKFDQFRKAWDNIMENQEALQEFDPEFPSLDHVHGQLQLKHCLYDGPHSTISKVLSTLVCMQNRLIDETLKIAVKLKPLSLSFLRRGEKAMIPCTSLADLISRDIVNFEWDDSVLKYSQNNVQYGYGRQVIYDFEKIEAEVASEILTNVKYLLMEDSLPKVIYADELFQNYVAMIKQIQKNIEQEPLPSDLVQAISKKKERDPRQILDFLTHLGMILSLLKKTSGKPDTSLVDYVDEWKNILTRPFPKSLLPSPENSIRLCHLVSLHELLEELNADSIIDSLDDTFRIKLSSHTQRKVSDLLSKNSQLAELALKAVKRFVHRYFSSVNIDISQKIINYLCEDSFWPLGMVTDGILKHGELVQDLETLFPEDVTVQNVHTFFQLLDSKVDESKKKDQRMTIMLQSLPSQTKAQGTNRRRAVAKGYSKT